MQDLYHAIHDMNKGFILETEEPCLDHMLSVYQGVNPVTQFNYGLCQYLNNCFKKQYHCLTCSKKIEV